MTAGEFAEEWAVLWSPLDEIHEWGAMNNWLLEITSPGTIPNPFDAATADYDAGRFNYYAYLRLYGWLASQDPDAYVADKYNLHPIVIGTGRHRVNIEVYPVKGGSISLAPASDTGYEPGTLLTITGLPAKGYRFAGMGVTKEGGQPEYYAASPVTITVDDGDVRVVAVFEAVATPSDLLNQVMPLMLVVMLMGAITPMMEEVAT